MKTNANNFIQSAIIFVFCVSTASYLFPCVNSEIKVEHGHKIEEYNVTTEDGYILTIFRLNKERCENSSTPILLMPGLLQNSDSWLDIGNASLPYLLCNMCHDIWIGNVRGNSYGKAHVNLDPTSKEFWDYSVEEIGFYDLPSIIDHILVQTCKDKINYIGFSEGISGVLIMGVERPEFLKKLGVIIGLSPATRLKYTRSSLLKVFFEAIRMSQDVLNKLGVYEIFGTNSLIQKLLGNLCNLNINKYVCQIFFTILDSRNPESIKDKDLRKVFKHFLVGTSLKNIVIYAQVMKAGKFQKYDYGRDNLAVYGSSEPPVYNISSITTPVVLLQGRNDYLKDIKDTEWTAKELPNLKELFIVNDKNWNHMDMMYSKNIRKVILPKIVEYLEKYN